ncbi:MAG TPA: transmembrane anchor protein, partial [Alphaproteobacteria bacterium]|nr:transmembrane anchor protein [Alphaproteobacteria bacterium]
AQAEQATSEPAADAPAAPPTGESDDLSFTLKPSEGTEYKLTMRKGAKATFVWEVTGGVVNYDLHGTATSGSETSYRKGREVQTDSGELVAAFDGAHGWFWRNRGTQDVTITLKTSGDYGELKRVK